MLASLRSPLVRARRHARRRDEGAVAVEAALLFPILVLLVFGMIEFSLLLRDYVTINSAVRTGARVAAAEPRVGTPAACQSPTEADSCFAQDAADAIERAGSAMPKDQIDYIQIYLANNRGFPSQSINWRADTTSNFNSCPAAFCYTYRWINGTGGNPGRFTWQSGTWNPQSINACPDDVDAMAVGVRMAATHQGITGLVGSSWPMSDHAVMKFEPLRPGTCKP